MSIRLDVEGGLASLYGMVCAICICGTRVMAGLVVPSWLVFFLGYLCRCLCELVLFVL